MSLKLFFGLPRCGKTSLFAKIASDYSKRISEGKVAYKMVYGNVHLTGIEYYRYIPFEAIGRYDLSDSLILIDEATIFADSRNHGDFSPEKVEYFLLHGHYRNDIFLFTQIVDRYDKTLREITEEIYYLRKPFIFGRWFTKTWRIPFKIIFPDPDSNSTNAGKIISGYVKPDFWTRLLSPIIFRPPYYKYFDSWEAPALPPLPSEKELEKILAEEKKGKKGRRATAYVDDGPSFLSSDSDNTHTE